MKIELRRSRLDSARDLDVELRFELGKMILQNYLVLSVLSLMSSYFAALKALTAYGSPVIHGCRPLRYLPVLAWEPRKS
jgi:hypothetical protein